MTDASLTSLARRLAVTAMLALTLWACHAHAADAVVPVAVSGNSPVMVERPNAGVVLTVPAGFDMLTLTAAGDIVRAVKSEKEIVLGRERIVQSIVVNAFGVVESDTAESCAETRMNELTSLRVGTQQPYRDVKVLGKASMPVAGSVGAGRLLSYTFQDVACVSGQVFLVREVPPYGRLGYLITVEVEQRFQPVLTQLLAEVLKSFTYIPFKHPIEMPMGKLGLAKEGPEGAFSIRVPDGWYAMDMERGLRLGCTDFLRGGVPLPLVDAVSVELHEDQDSKELAKRVIAKYNRMASVDKMVGAVFSDGDCKLDGADGYQFVYRVVPEKPVIVPGQPADPAELRVHRMVCVPTGRKGVIRNYALLMVLRGEDVPAALAIMDKLAEGFKIQQDTSVPFSTELSPGIRLGTTTTAPTSRPTSRSSEGSIFAPAQSSIFGPSVGPASRPSLRPTSGPTGGLPK